MEDRSSHRLLIILIPTSFPIFPYLFFPSRVYNTRLRSLVNYSTQERTVGAAFLSQSISRFGSKLSFSRRDTARDKAFLRAFGGSAGTCAAPGAGRDGGPCRAAWDRGKEGGGGEVSEGVREALSSALWQERVGVHEYHGTLIQRGTNQR